MAGLKMAPPTIIEKLAKFTIDKKDDEEFCLIAA